MQYTNVATNNPIIIRLKKNNNKLIKKFERHEKLLNDSVELKI